MTKARKKLYLLFGIYFVALVLYIASVPTQAIWNRLDPHLLGMPFNQCNIILVQLLIAIGLMVFYKKDYKLQMKETEMRKRGEKIEY